MLSNSAYSSCKYIAQSFKKVSGESSLHPQKETFNTVLGQVCVKSEHCIGTLKNRFAAFKRISATIKGARLHGFASVIDYTLYLVRPALALGCIVLLGGVAGHYILYAVLAGFGARLLVYLHHCAVSIQTLLPDTVSVDSDVVLDDASE